MHHRQLTVLSTLLVLAAGLALAAELPKRKPGLWEMTLSSPDSKRPPRSARYCIDAATEALLDDFATAKVLGPLRARLRTCSSCFP